MSLNAFSRHLIFYIVSLFKVLNARIGGRKWNASVNSVSSPGCQNALYLSTRSFLIWYMCMSVSEKCPTWLWCNNYHTSYEFPSLKRHTNALTQWALCPVLNNRCLIKIWMPLYITSLTYSKRGHLFCFWVKKSELIWYLLVTYEP